MTSRYSRRGVLLGGAGALAVGVGIGVGADQLLTDSDEPMPSSTAAPGLTSADLQPGTYQPGINRPATPAAHLLATVLAWPGAPKASQLVVLLAKLGREILQITESQPSELLPDGPGDLTVQVGLGARLVHMFDASLPGATSFPVFKGSDRLERKLRTGDVVLMVAASEPTSLNAVTQHLMDHLPGVEIGWQQFAVRAHGEGTVTRNPLGYRDGIIVPDDDEDMDRGVWITSGPLAGGSIGAIRRFTLDLDRFDALTTAEQDAVIGRKKISGAPLSGGGPNDQVDLFSKTPAGEYLTPVHAHARAAHPSFTASPLMMRRSYGFTNGSDGGEATSGLLFISYQNDLDTFSKTQLRLDEVDALMGFSTPTAEISFLVLPGFSSDRPLGSTLPLP